MELHTLIFFKSRSVIADARIIRVRLALETPLSRGGIGAGPHDKMLSDRMQTLCCQQR